MKLPNGYGSVYKLSGKRRNPWAARKTVGWTYSEANGKSYPKYEFVGFYKTKQEALQALALYNSDPYDLRADGITLNELYEKWSDRHFVKIEKPANIKSTWKVCEPLYDKPITDLKLAHFQKLFDESGKNYPVLNYLKIILGQMYDFAVKYEMVNADKRNMIRYIDLSQKENPNKIERVPFSKEEIALLWEKVKTDMNISIVLILIYTGVRIGELFEVQKSDVDLKNKAFSITESKTEAGIREVPIADKILPFFEYWMGLNNNQYLITTKTGSQMIYSNYLSRQWNGIKKMFNVKHRPHDTRHTCISLLTEAGIDDRIIKQIIGHKGTDITQSVYTHIDLKTKLDAINRI